MVTAGATVAILGLMTNGIAQMGRLGRMRMIDADALVEKCGSWYTEEGTEEGFIGTLKSLIDKQPTIGGWISVKDRLPNTYRHVITYDKYSGVKENWILRSNPYVSWSQGFHITHWMPMPEQPKQNLVDK